MLRAIFSMMNTIDFKFQLYSSIYIIFFVIRIQIFHVFGFSRNVKLRIFAVIQIHKSQ